ncbi:CRAL-TRIO lipid binding domain containing protein [Parasponia andersonii]|uniref:CRAL-TRIO lipid binding domain containing protein n=1 Tax=Parasponia andersonii TaxID=3476 RepID=A0A2P5AM65_PARAD|nr:CRAL-TRIO lipid binding domain containing protein [Parasponia andersonii]
MEEETSNRETCSKTDENENEKSKVAIMRALVQNQDPSSKEMEWFNAAEISSSSEYGYRQGFQTSSSTTKAGGAHSSPTAPSNPHKSKKKLIRTSFFMQGLDRKGRPIVLLYGGRHKQAPLPDFKRVPITYSSVQISFVVYCLDKICARMPSGQEKFVAIGDLQGWGYANSDIRGYLAALSILPCALIFMTAWKMVYPFIDNNTKKKIMFVEDEDLKSTLLSDIDESQLPVTYGGQLALVPIQDC